MYQYLNKNPMGIDTSDCTIRAISMAQGKTWDTTYIELSELARKRGMLFSDVEFVEDYLDQRYPRTCYKNKRLAMTINEFAKTHSYGNYLCTMNGHITYVSKGKIFDTFDCGNKIIWCAWEV